MSPDVVDLAAARKISDERAVEIKRICAELVPIVRKRADLMNKLRIGAVCECDGEILIDLCVRIADATKIINELSEAGFAAGSQKLT